MGKRQSNERSEITRVVRARRMGRAGTARAIRVASRLSLRDAAKALGVNPTTLWRWEEGHIAPRPESALLWDQMLSDLAETLGEEPTTTRGAPRGASPSSTTTPARHQRTRSQHER